MAFYVDAFDESTSNWPRWVNCARNEREENVLFYSCKGKAYYVTFRDVYPGEELLVYYGNSYAETLGIDLDKYSS